MDFSCSGKFPDLQKLKSPKAMVQRKKTLVSCQPEFIYIFSWQNHSQTQELLCVCVCVCVCVNRLFRNVLFR